MLVAENYSCPLSFEIVKLAFFTLFRRNENDVKAIYNRFSDLMRIGTGGNFLNFGFWDKDTENPLQAQLNLTHKVGHFGSFQDAKEILDVGSGYSAPALTWLMDYPSSKVHCVNISGVQLLEVRNNLCNSKLGRFDNFDWPTIQKLKKRLSLIESTSTNLPIRSKSMDRIVAFESAQHFRPLDHFVSESSRILRKSGLLIIAIPIMAGEKNVGFISEFSGLGILNLTWASEHYRLRYIQSILKKYGFLIQKTQFIGSSVYTPMTDYYSENRNELIKSISSKYPQLLEKILNKSMLQMKNASKCGLIDYVLISSIKVN